MFTGLIDRVGKIRGRKPGGSGVALDVYSGPDYEVGLGDSVAVSGLCLTVTGLAADGFKVDVSSESLARSTLADLAVGAGVNLERALRLGDRLGGHLVSGHVDAVGRVADVRPEGTFARVTVFAPPEITELTVEKGSIAVDGISLTVNGVERDRFWMMIIPETLSRTTLGDRRQGDKVNLETDLIGKYVAKLMGKDKAQTADRELMKKLSEEGFL